LNHLVGGGQQRFRDGQAERLRGFGVNDELELGRLLWVDMVRSRPLACATGRKLFLLHRHFPLFFVR
jgi:hypothetical protein